MTKNIIMLFEEILTMKYEFFKILGSVAMYVSCMQFLMLLLFCGIVKSSDLYCDIEH
jgi:hypothetical protein